MKNPPFQTRGHRTQLSGLNPRHVYKRPLFLGWKPFGAVVGCVLRAGDTLWALCPYWRQQGYCNKILMSNHLVRIAKVINTRQRFPYWRGSAETIRQRDGVEEHRPGRGYLSPCNWFSGRYSQAARHKVPCFSDFGSGDTEVTTLKQTCPN